MIKEYYRLAKPGIVYGNLLTTVAAFFFATKWAGVQKLSPFVLLFIATALGISLVIGSASVFNNYLDRDIDRKMQRTQHRALVTGAISVRSALVYGTVLGVLGFALLFFFVNVLTAYVALFGWVMYVIVYGLAKRTSAWGALVGSVPGAVPIVVGYTAVTNHLDGTALILFLILAFWQMPHFYAIAVYRLKEYQAAGIPVFPAKYGIRTTKFHILAFIILYMLATLALAFFSPAGIGQYVYFALMLVLGFVWLWRGVQGFIGKKNTKADEKWARKLFFFSLIVLMAFCITIALVPALDLLHF